MALLFSLHSTYWSFHCSMHSHKAAWFHDRGSHDYDQHCNAGYGDLLVPNSRDAELWMFGTVCPTASNDARKGSPQPQASGGHVDYEQNRWLDPLDMIHKFGSLVRGRGNIPTDGRMRCYRCRDAVPDL
jgi:hypothetical protein